MSTATDANTFPDMGAALDTLIINHPAAKAPKIIRLSRNIRRVIDLMVHEGLKTQDALKAVGITDSAYYYATAKPEFAQYQQEQMRVKRSGAVARTIAKAEDLMDGAESEHVQMEAVKYLNPPIQRSENVHLHQHVIPGLTVIRGAWDAHTDDVQVIDSLPHQSRKPHVINMIGTPVPHPEAGNALKALPAPEKARAPKTRGGGEKR